MQARSIFETCLCAHDLDATCQFYHEVMGLEVASDMRPRGVVFRCGSSYLLVFNPEETALPKPYEGRSGEVIPAHGTTGIGHVAFLADSEELPGWREKLKGHGVPIVSEVNWKEGGTSLYFLDPAGNVLELAPPTLWGGIAMKS